MKILATSKTTPIGVRMNLMLVVDTKVGKVPNPIGTLAVEMRKR